jgi:hypothetical protein
MVSYELTQGPKGNLAQNIRPLDAQGNPVPAAGTGVSESAPG